jgi:hypothetical protein
MAGRPSIPTNSSALIAIIADEDTVTGFLLAGVGNVDLRKKTNYLIVDNSNNFHLLICLISLSISCCLFCPDFCLLQ